MPNVVDQRIDEILQEHVRECERLNVSRNVQVTKQRIAEALKTFSKLEVVASGHWEAGSDAEKIQTLREALGELTAEVKSLQVIVMDLIKKPEPTPAPVKQVELEEAIEAAPVAKKPARKPKVAVA